MGDVMRIYGMYVNALTKLVDTSPATPLDSRDKAINAVSQSAPMHTWLIVSQ